MDKKKRNKNIRRGTVAAAIIAALAYFGFDEFGLGNDSFGIFDEGNQDVIEIIINEDTIQYDGEVLSLAELENKFLSLDDDYTFDVIDNGATNKTFNDVIDLLDKYDLTH